MDPAPIDTIMIEEITNKRVGDNLPDQPPQKKLKTSSPCLGLFAEVSVLSPGTEMEMDNVDEITELFNDLQVDEKTTPKRKERRFFEERASKRQCLRSKLLGSLETGEKATPNQIEEIFSEEKAPKKQCLRAKLLGDLQTGEKTTPKRKEEFLFDKRAPKKQCLTPVEVKDSVFCNGWKSQALVIQGKKLVVDWEALSKFSPFFEDGGLYGQELDSISYQAVQDCINATTGAYDVTQEKSIERAYLYLDGLERLEMKIFFSVAEQAVIRLLDKVSMETLEKCICIINQQFYERFCEGLFPDLRKKLGTAGLPILVQYLHQVKLKMKLFRAVEGRVLLFDLIRDLCKKGFPGDGCTIMFKKGGVISDVLKHDSKEVTEFFENIHFLDPMNCDINLCLGSMYKSRHGVGYGNAERYFRNVLIEGVPQYVDCASSYLSELLQTGPEGLIEAKKLLEKTINDNFKCSHRSRVALAQILLEEDSMQNVQDAYGQLFYLINHPSNNGFESENKLVKCYFQYIFVTRKVHPMMIGFDRIEEAIVQAERLGLEAVVHRLIFSIYSTGFFTKIEENQFIEAFINDQTRSNMMDSLKATAFYALALEAISYLPRRNTIKQLTGVWKEQC